MAKTWNPNSDIWRLRWRADSGTDLRAECCVGPFAQLEGFRRHPHLRLWRRAWPRNEHGCASACACHQPAAGRLR
jgi:hypothetical protein